MSTPKAVQRLPIEQPLARMQNVPAEVTPAAVQDFEHHAGYSFAAGLQARFLSAWGFPWWLADPESAPFGGGFDTGFDSGFEGGIDSPQGAGFSSGFSSGFGS